MRSYAGVDYNLTLCISTQESLQHIYHGQPYARVDLNPTVGHSRLYPPGKNLDLASDVCSHI